MSVTLIKINNLTELSNDDSKLFGGKNERNGCIQINAYVLMNLWSSGSRSWLGNKPSESVTCQHGYLRSLAVNGENCITGKFEAVGGFWNKQIYAFVIKKVMLFLISTDLWS